MEEKMSNRLSNQVPKEPGLRLAQLARHFAELDSVMAVVLSGSRGSGGDDALLQSRLAQFEIELMALEMRTKCERCAAALERDGDAEAVLESVQRAQESGGGGYCNRPGDVVEPQCVWRSDGVGPRRFGGLRRR